MSTTTDKPENYCVNCKYFRKVDLGQLHPTKPLCTHSEIARINLDPVTGKQWLQAVRCFRARKVCNGVLFEAKLSIFDKLVKMFKL